MEGGREGGRRNVGVRELEGRKVGGGRRKEGGRERGRKEAGGRTKVGVKGLVGGSKGGGVGRSRDEEGREGRRVTGGEREGGRDGVMEGR